MLSCGRLYSACGRWRDEIPRIRVREVIFRKVCELDVKTRETCVLSVKYRNFCHGAENTACVFFSKPNLGFLSFPGSPLWALIFYPSCRLACSCCFVRQEDVCVLAKIKIFLSLKKSKDQNFWSTTTWCIILLIVSRMSLIQAELHRGRKRFSFHFSI